MSRSGYDDNYGDDDPLALGRYRAAVVSALRGKRGQKFLRELIEALDALPEKKLVPNVFERRDAETGIGMGEFCSLGSVARLRGIEQPTVNDEEYDDVAPEAAATFGIAESMAREIMFWNDEGPHEETPEARWSRMRRWAGRHLIEREH